MPQTTQRRSRTKPVPPETQADIVRRYTKLGQSLNIIHFATDISVPRIRDVLTSHGVEIAAPGPGEGFQIFTRTKVARA